MGNSQLLFESIFKRSVSADDTGDYLVEICEQYPYFTAAQFYLLQQTDISSNKYISQAGKTALLFNNAFWLNYQLENLNAKELLTQPANDILLETPAQSGQVQKEPGLEDKNTIAINPDAIKQQPTGLDEPTESADAPISLPVNNIINHPTITGTSDKNNRISSVQNERPAAEYQPIILRPLDNTENKPLSELEQSFLSTFSDADNTDSTDGYYEEEIPTADESEIEPMNIRLNFTPDIATTEETISFEPLHTSDYFASLGIKFNEDGKPVDKLGRQLKSFTEWLKTMKKIHTDQLAATTEQTDTIIQKMAEKSNTEGDVLTEAMAEVLVQQGKARKAIEVYQKLSLLNPVKSAYFAAKIEQIAR